MAHRNIRGRGAAHDPPNRFEPITLEREEWAEAGDPAPETQFFRDASRSIIARNQSPDVGFDASVNPYRGCDRGCVYCHSGDTEILMASGSTKAIANLAVGDAIYGTIRQGLRRKFVETRVLALWPVAKHAYRVTLADGTELVASADHRFLTWRGWKFVTGRDQGSLRRPHLTTNDRLMGVGMFAVQPFRDVEYMRGYLCGMIRGDGHLASYAYERAGRSHGNVHQFRLALADRQPLERTASYLRVFGLETRSFPFGGSRWGRKPMHAIATSSRLKVDRIRDLVGWPTQPTENWSRGYLAGIFDAEGSYSANVLRISNTDNAIVDQTTRALLRLGLRAVIEGPQQRRQGRPMKVVRIPGGLRAHLRFFHSTDPAIDRKRRIAGTTVKTTTSLRVVEIAPLGPADLYDIQTGTGDFIANGVVSHNCFARPTHEYFGLSAGLDFETKIFVKEDAPELLRRELSSPKWEPQTLVMSGVTDPYQSIERRLGITRRCLEVMAEFRNPVAIITKSHLVTRDADLLGELAGHDAAVVNVSVTTLRRDLQRVMEPRAPTPERRLDAIRQLSKAGVPTRVMVAPVVPGLTDHEVPAILEAAAKAGALRAAWVMLRLPWSVKELFEDWLERHFPDRKEKVLNRLRDLHGGNLYDSKWGNRMRGEGAFVEQIEQMFEIGCRKAGLNRVELELSTAAFRRPDPVGQLGLFAEGA